MRLLVFLHVVAAVIFLGNIITAAYWKLRADSIKEVQVIHTTAKNVMFADKVFTNPSILVLVGTGIVLGINGPYSMAEFNWLTTSLFLFIIMGILFIAILTPIQKRLIESSQKEFVEKNGWKPYESASNQWALYGILLTIIPLVILYLMVMKPF